MADVARSAVPLGVEFSQITNPMRAILLEALQRLSPQVAWSVAVLEQWVSNRQLVVVSGERGGSAIYGAITPQISRLLATVNLSNVVTWRVGVLGWEPLRE
jgi:hypothetical protein